MFNLLRMRSALLYWMGLWAEQLHVSGFSRVQPDFVTSHF